MFILNVTEKAQIKFQLIQMFGEILEVKEILYELLEKVINLCIVYLIESREAKS